MYKLIIFTLVAAVTCNDLIQGSGGRKIFDEEKQASPALWKQTNAITVKVNDTEVISRVVITDRRPNKDGESKITDGGVGQKNVTVELKSPTVLRGYDFHIEVYATEDNGEKTNTNEEPLSPEEVPMTTEEVHVNTEEVPMTTEEIATMENDTQVNLNAKSEGNATSDDQAAEVVDPKAVDPIAKYVSENKSEVPPMLTNLPLHALGHQMKQVVKGASTSKYNEEFVEMD